MKKKIVRFGDDMEQHGIQPTGAVEVINGYSTHGGCNPYNHGYTHLYCPPKYVVHRCVWRHRWIHSYFCIFLRVTFPCLGEVPMYISVDGCEITSW